MQSAAADSPLPVRRGAAAAGLLLWLVGCGPPLATVVRDGRFEDAWRLVCDRLHGQESYRDPRLLSSEERRALRAALLRRTSAALLGRALSRQALNERLGVRLLPAGVVLLQVHIAAAAHPGWGVLVEPRLVVAGRPYSVWAGQDLWRLVELKPRPGSPTAPSKLDPTTPLQEDALRLLESTGYGCSSLTPGRIDVPCQGTFLLAPGARSQPPSELISLDEPGGAPAQDALVLRVSHLVDRHLGDLNQTHRCSNIGYDVTLPLPPGEDVAARLQGIFAGGPIDLAPPPAAPAPRGGP